MGHSWRWACRFCRKAAPLTSRHGTPGNAFFTKPQQTPALAHKAAAAQQYGPAAAA
jgi:hypothetical protein